MQNDARYQFARSCVFCGEKSNLPDEDGSAYCHMMEMFLVSQGDCLDGCAWCPKYRPRRKAQ